MKLHYCLKKSTSFCIHTDIDINKMFFGKSGIFFLKEKYVYVISQEAQFIES